MNAGGVKRAARRARALAAVLMVAGLLASLAGQFGGAHAAAAQRDEAGVDGNTYTGETFDWSVEWDEDAWTVSESNSGSASDYLMLETAKGHFAFAVFIAQAAEDAESCIDFWFESMEKGGKFTDIERSDEMGTLPLPRDGADAAYTYDPGQGSAAGYAQCRMLDDGDAALLMVLTTTPGVYEDRLELYGELIATVEGAGQPVDNENEDTTDEPANDEDNEPNADSGIDGETYTSPTYGYWVDWSGTSWEASAVDELVNEQPGSIALDRLLLQGTQGLFYVEGKQDYGGDPADCLAGEVDATAETDGVLAVEPYEERGEVVEGDGDGDGRYGAYVLTVDDESDEIEWMAYIECRPLAEGESVIVFTLLTSPKSFEEELDAAQAIIETLSLADEDRPEEEDDEEQKADGEEDTVLLVDNITAL